MFLFTSLLERGARVAAMSDMSDGDCRLPDASGGSARPKFCQSCGLDISQVATGKQVHGAAIAVVRKTDGGHRAVQAPFPDTDGLITCDEGIPLGISIADCVPVFILDPVRRAIALVHAGRVGTFNGIVTVAVNAMRDNFGTNPQNIHAVIGPSAGPKAYEVSAEIAGTFAAAGYPVRGRFLDLWQANAIQLERCGVPTGQIEITAHCTITGGQFYSHRSHGDGARNFALLML